MLWSSAADENLPPRNSTLPINYRDEILKMKIRIKSYPDSYRDENPQPSAAADKAI
jgi:hypothetical protein